MKKPTIRLDRLVLLGMAAVLLATGPRTAAAADAPDLRCERHGLASEAKGRYEEALEHYACAFREAAAQARASVASADTRAAALARAEVYLLKLDFLGEKTARFTGVAEIVQVAREAGLPPLLDARAAAVLSRTLEAQGKRAEAKAAIAGLGLVRGFAICGPFDNERGGGVQTAYEPETKVDLAGRYRGKARDVGWFFPFAPADDAGLDLDAILRPNDEAVAYALAYVRSGANETLKATLRIGSDEGVKVWWNDALVLSRDVNRVSELDQDAVPVHLPPGWNKLLVKVAERKGPWSLLVRITDPEGRPIPDLVEASAEEVQAGVPYATGYGAKRWDEIEAARGAMDHYERLAATGKATALDYFHLGYLHYRRRAHDENEHPDRDAFRKAVELDPKNAVFRTYLSFVSASVGEYSVNREENARRQELERALELDPEHARAAFHLADYYARSLRNVAKGEAYLERALAANPAYLEALLLKGDLLAAKGFGATARAFWRELQTRAPGAETHPDALRKLAAAAKMEQDPDRAERLLEAALRIDFADAAARAELVALREERGDVEGALAALAERAALRPFDRGARLERARLLVGLDRLGEAEAELAAATAIAREDEAAIAELGRVALRAGAGERAIGLFEEALALNPSLVEIRKYVEFLKEEVRPFEDDHRIDPDAAIEAAKAVPMEADVAVRTLLELVVSKVNQDGTSSEFTEEVVRIENDDGVEAYDHVSVAYAVGEQRVTFRRATVVKKDGRREEARIEDYGRERPVGEFTTYGRRYVDLPAVEVGDIVIVEHRVDDLSQSFFGDYFGHVHYFGGTQPVERSRYVLVVPSDRTFFFNARKKEGVEAGKAVSPDGKTATHWWEKRRIAKVESEPNMPPLYDEVLPVVQVSTFKDWDAFARWYWNLVKTQHEVSDEMRAKVLELTAEAATPAEKIREIYNFVVTDVRYNSEWEFGIHGFKPYNATSIFARRFGDCKDKATLINTMLSLVGIPSYPVLIDGQTRRGTEDLSLPLMNHFNHCIAYVPPGPEGVPEEGWFLDGTAQHHEADNLPTMDFGATVLIVKPDGGEIQRIRWPEPMGNGVIEVHTVSVAADGSGTVESDVAPSGGYAVVTRSWFSNAARRKEELEKIYGRFFSGAAVVEEDFGPLKDLNRAVRIRFRLKVPKVMKQTAAGDFALEEVPSVLFRTLYTRGDKLSGFAPKAERQFDVVLPVPSGVDETI